MFSFRQGLVLFYSDRPGSHVAMFAPNGEKLVFRDDASHFHDESRSYTWAFAWEGETKDGDVFVFATTDRVVVGEVSGNSIRPSSRTAYATREEGRPIAVNVSAPKSQLITLTTTKFPTDLPNTSVRCLFVNPSVPYGQWACFRPGVMNEASFSSHGMAYVSATLKNAGHECWMVDLRTLSNWAHTESVLKQEQFDIVFVGFLSIDCFNAAAVVRLLKELHPNKPVVVGGLHVSIAKEGIFPRPDLIEHYCFGNEDLLPGAFREFLAWKGEGHYVPSRFPLADYVILDDGEIAARNLVAELAAGRRPVNRTIEGGAVPMEVARHMDRDLFDLNVEAYSPILPFQPTPMATVTWARGCPFHCTYCNLSSQLSNTNVRTKPPELVREELEDLHQRFGGVGVKSIMIHDDLTFHSKAIADWCEVLLSRWNGIPLWLQTRSPMVIKWYKKDRPFWELLCRAGLTWVSVGYECIDGESQVLMDSGETRSIKDATGNAVAIDNNMDVVKADSVLIDQGKVLEMLHVETDTQEITASLEHRFFCFNDGQLVEVKAKNIKVGDWITICRGAPGLGSDTMSKSKAELAGFLLGDGTLTETSSKKYKYKGKSRARKTTQHITRFRLSQKGASLLQYYANIILEEFGINVNVNKSPSRRTHTLETASTDLVTWAQGLRRFGKDGYIEIPDIIMKGNDQVIASFLRGYYDAEGSVSVKEKKIVVVCKNERPMKQIKSLLMRLGITSGKVFRQDYTNKLGDFTQYSVWIRQADAVRRFADIIGFNHSERAKKLIVVVKNLEKVSRKGEYLPFSGDFLRRVIAVYGPGKGKIGLVSMKKLRKPLARVMFGNNRSVCGVRRCDLNAVVKMLSDAGCPTCPELDIIKYWLRVEDLGFERVREIVSVGRRRAYDLHVSKHHTYIANGFMVHNSGSQRMLDYMKKDSSVEENIECGRILDEFGINSFGNFLWGVFGEEPDDAEATVRLVEKIRPGYLSGSVYASYPGTAQDKECREKGLIVEGSVYERSHLPWQYTIKGIDYAHVFDCRNRAGQYANYLRMPKLLCEDRQRELAETARGLPIHSPGTR